LNTINRYISKFRNQIFFLFVAIISAFGAYIAYRTVDRYESLVNGVLGSAVLYSLYIIFLSPRRIIKEPVEVRLEFPKDLRLLVLGFFLAIVAFWAGIRIIDLAWYLWYLF
jgi:Ca2+/Na+ antiporter